MWGEILLFETDTSVGFIVYHPDDNSWTDMDNVKKSSKALYKVPSSGSITIECLNFHCIRVQRYVDPVPHVLLPHVQRADGLFNDVTLNAVCACEAVSIFLNQCHHMSLMYFVVSPPGYGRSVTDFWGWDAHEAQLRCPDEVDGDIWSTRRGLKPTFYWTTQTMGPMGIFPSRENPHGRTGNQTRDLMFSSQKLWPLDHEAGPFRYCLTAETKPGLLCNMPLYEQSVTCWGIVLWLDYRSVAAAVSSIQRGNVILFAVLNQKLTVSFLVLTLCFRNMSFLFNLEVWHTFHSMSCRNKTDHFSIPNFVTAWRNAWAHS
jgi:hypothetical protein